MLERKMRFENDPGKTGNRWMDGEMEAHPGREEWNLKYFEHFFLASWTSLSSFVLLHGGLFVFLPVIMCMFACDYMYACLYAFL